MPDLLFMYYTYVLYSSDFDQIYIGQTNNLEKRLTEHNSGLSASTKRYLPWQMIYFERYEGRREAMFREKELKSHQGRNWIRKELLHQDN
jgi:putative endonuclease